MDNSTTHAPKQLERWPQEQIEANGWTLSIQVYWLPVNASLLDQIETWFSILHMNFIAYHNQTAKPIQWSYTVEKLEQKLGAN